MFVCYIFAAAEMQWRALHHSKSVYGTATTTATTTVSSNKLDDEYGPGEGFRRNKPISSINIYIYIYKVTICLSVRASLRA